MQPKIDDPFLLSVDDVVDWAGLIERLRNPDGNAISQRILELFPSEVRSQIIDAPTGNLDQTQKEQFVAALNENLKRIDFNQAPLETLASSEDAKKILRRSNGKLLPPDAVQFNRRILEATYPEEIRECIFNPYVGPPSFSRGHRRFFFGRDEEAIELASLITAHSAVLLYSQSGAGKTSLLHAKLIPKLEEEEQFVVLPPMRVQGQVPSSFKIKKKTNIFVLNALMSCSKGDVSPAKLAGLTFADFLKEQPKCMNQYGEPCPTVLVFDQFEELFTFYPSRWPDRQTFFEQLGDALQGNQKKGIEGDPLLRVIFCMREDFIAELDPYVSHLPEKLRSRFRLEHLREGKALLAITEPLEKTKRSYAKDVGEQLVKNLLRIPSYGITGTQSVGLYVEPVQLQVVCQTLWDALKPNENVITREHLDEYGDVNQALSKFYERSIGSVAGETGIKEEFLRNWFGDTLISPEGTRAPVNRGPDHTGGMPNDAVEKLEAMRLIKGEWKGTNVRWYELAHDRFIEPIRRSNDAWLAKHSRSEQIRLRLENKASKWKPGGSVLEPGELIEAQSLVKAKTATDALRQLVDASRANTQRRRIRFFKMLGAIAVIAAVAFLGIAVFAIYQRWSAQKTAGLAKSRLLAIRAADHVNSDPELSVLLAKEALDQFGDTAAAKDVIRAGLLNLSNVDGVLMGHTAPVKSAQYSPDGRFILTTSEDQIARLWDAGSRRIVSQLGQTPTTLFAAFSPDGKLIWTAGSDNVARLWEGTTGRLMKELIGHHGAINCAAFSADSRLIATASDDKTSRVWFTSTGELFKELLGHTAEVHHISFSPDGKLIATEANDSTARIWSLDSNKAISLEGLTGPTSAVAFSPDSKLLATEGARGTEQGRRSEFGDYPVTVWDAQNGKMKLILGGHQKPISGVSFSPDGKFIVTSGADNSVRLWNIRGELVALLVGHSNTVSSARFSYDSKLLLTASADNTARLWNGVSGAAVATLRGHSTAVNSAVFSPDSKVVMTASDDKSVRFWRVDNQDTHGAGMFIEHTDRILSAAFSPDGKQIITTGSEGGALVEDIRSGRPLERATFVSRSPARVVDAVFSPDGKFVATTKGNTAQLWKATVMLDQEVFLVQGLIDMPERNLGKDTDGLQHWVNSVAFSPNGELLVTASTDTNARVWNTSTGELLATLAHPNVVNGAAFSPDGKFIITAGADSEVRIWNVGSYNLVRTLGTQMGDVATAQYSPDGRWIVTASWRVANLWNATTGKKVAQLSGHKDKINSASFSGNSKLLVTSSDDKTARVWNVQTGKLITVLRGHGASVLDAKFSPDGQFLLTASDDYTARLYSYWEFAPFEELKELIPRRVMRTLTEQERQEYLVEPHSEDSGLIAMPQETPGGQP